VGRHEQRLGLPGRAPDRHRDRGADTEIHNVHNTPGNVIEVRLDGSFVAPPVVGGVTAILRATR
jgi:hypothetical protein